MPRFGHHFHGSEVTAKDLDWLQDKLLFDRIPVQQRYLRFFVLLFLSVIIATYGVLGDSTATVIGAMIVAPLMTPIMAVSLSAVSGDHRNIIRSLLTVAVGTGMAVLLAYLLTLLVPGQTLVVNNSQITSRVSPGLLDLVIALAAGAAGAFATGREDVSDALPGVAIAVSLVPPLSVVGVCLADGLYPDALGAFLLFLTNFLAIVMAGLLVFAAMGYGGAAMEFDRKKTRRRAIVIIVIATLIIMVPLGIASHRVAVNEFLKDSARDAVENWLGGTDFTLYSLQADGKEVDLVIAGAGDAPPIDGLLERLGQVEKGVEVTVRIIQEDRLQGYTPQQ